MAASFSGSGSASAKDPAPIIESGKGFFCTPVAVWYGDGPLWCEEGPRVRLSCVNAQEMDEPACKPGFPCVEVSGLLARDALVDLVGTPTGDISPHGHIIVEGPTMTCVSNGEARGVRTAAFCVLPKSGELSCRMLEGGWVAKWSKYWGDHTCP
jgi:hypothetical protein